MSNPFPRSRSVFAAILLLPAFLGGCATATNPRDPLEPFNRGVYQFNETLDRFVVKPVAEGYRFVLPQLVRTSINNFFSNLNDVTVLANNVLQGKFLAALDDFSRIAINSTIGMLGLFDIASEAGIQKHNEDFGQTLGVWGLAEGPFVMLPFFGPSTGRDTVGLVGDFYTDPLRSTDPVHLRNQARGLRIVDHRAQLLDASKVLEAAALDPYEFLRDAYLQRRRNLIYDGKPPLDKDLDIAPPPKDRKGDAEVRGRVASAPPSLRGSVIAGEDHVPQVRVEPQHSAHFATPGQPAGVGRTQPGGIDAATVAGGGPLFDGERREALAQAPAVSPPRNASGSSTLMRLWRYIKESEGPAPTPDGS
jgi:phospholipid-binding lipoprotein MlaA